MTRPGDLAGPAALAVLLAVFLCRAALAAAVIPPWQGPDEPTHFSLARLLSLGDDATGYVVLPDSTVITARHRQVQREVVESMLRHRWWEPYGVPPPQEPMDSFYEARLGPGTYAQPLYYGLAAGVLRAAGPATTDGAYAWLRALSVALGVCTLILGWAGTRLLFGPAVALGATAVAVLHPQFLLSSLTVNPDALVNVCGAVAWWQCARLFQERRLSTVLVLLLALGAAVLTKRSAVPFVVATIGALTVTAWLRAPAGGQRVSRQGVALAAGAATVMAVALWLSGPLLDPLATFWTTIESRRAADAATARVGLDYVLTGIDATWLVAGWLRFPAPDAWLFVARGLTAAAIAGSLILLYRVPALRWRISFAWMLAAGQAAAILLVAFWTVVSPEGRYLFSVLAPMAALFWLALTQGIPAPLQPYAPAAVLGVLALLDVSGFATVLVPSYLP